MFYSMSLQLYNVFLTENIVIFALYLIWLRNEQLKFTIYCDLPCYKLLTFSRANMVNSMVMVVGVPEPWSLVKIKFYWRIS